MINIDIKTENAKAIQDQLKGIRKERWGAILTSAATETAFYVRNKLRSEMPRVIDRPRPYTINSIYVDKGRRGETVEATVKWRDSIGQNSGGRYLRPLVDGGDRNQKGFEKLLIARRLMSPGNKAVPTKEAPQDSYGNVPGSYLTRMLSFLRVLRDPLQNRRYANGARGGVGKKVAAKTLQFFTVPVRTGNLRPGIYERKNFFGTTGIRKVFSFVPSVHYKKQFPFYDIGRQASLSKFPEKLQESIAKYLNNPS